jgi:hypothetical protein
MIKIVTLIDLHIVLTYDCWHCFLVFNIWVSHALEMTIYIFITQPLSCFVFHLPNLLLTQNFVYPTLFSSVPPPTINNDRSLIEICIVQCYFSNIKCPHLTMHDLLPRKAYWKIQIFTVLKKIRCCSPWRNHPFAISNSFKQFRFFRVSVRECQNWSYIPATVAIVWSRPHCDKLFVEHILVALVNKLMSPADQF